MMMLMFYKKMLMIFYKKMLMIYFYKNMLLMMMIFNSISTVLS